jgi:hypothetical protein
MEYLAAGITYAIYTANTYIIIRQCNGNFMLFKPYMLLQSINHPTYALFDTPFKAYTNSTVNGGNFILLCTLGLV